MIPRPAAPSRVRGTRSSGRWWAAALGAWCTVVLGSCGGDPAPDASPPHPDGTRPNFVMVVVDALRRDHLGSYGYHRATSPFIDSLAARGVRFENAWSQAPQTLNSTATMFTSRDFPYLLRGVDHEPIPGIKEERQQVWARTPRLAEDNLTLAEVLHEAGYQTLGLFTNPHHHPSSGFWQGFEDARYLTRTPEHPYARIDVVCAEFESWCARRDRTRPFFAYLHVMDVHNPYRPPAAQQALFPPGDGRYVFVKGRPSRPLDPEDLETTRALYDGEVRWVDDTLGTTLKRLARQGELDNTMVVLTSDHGEEFMDHGGLGHGTGLEPELLRIPLVMAGGPVAGAPGRRIWPLVRNLDLAPTLVELAGSPMPETFRGMSLAAVVRGVRPTSQTRRLTSFARVGAERSLTSQRWHLMWNRATGDVTLYDLASDPAGTRNVAEDHPKPVRHLRTRLRSLEELWKAAEKRSDLLHSTETAGETDVDLGPIMRQLEALGYADSGT